MRSIHKKLTYEDAFGRKYYCQRARRGLIKFQKNFNHKKFRRILKQEIKENNDV